MEPVVAQELRRGSVEFCVLALLAERESYGFELVRRLAESDGMFASEGTIYNLLSRLRRAGLVSTAWHESLAGPPRRYYSLTEDGHRSLDEFRDEWRRYRNAVDRLLGTRGEAQ